MSKAETTALVERYYAALNAHDADGLLACLSEDVAHDINQKGREIGREKFRWYLADTARHVSEEISDIVIMCNDTGSRAAAEFTVRGKYRETIESLPQASGQSFSLAAGAFFEIDGGAISRVSTYYNRAELIRQLEGG